MSLKGNVFAILAEEEYQDLDLHYPRFRLQEERVRVLVVSTGSSHIYKGVHGLPVSVDLDINMADPYSIDGLIIPGGWAVDKLRQLPSVLKLVSVMMKTNKIIGCIGTGGWILSSANVVTGRKLTSQSSIKEDLIHAGAKWIDAEAVVDGNLITSRVTDDLPAFMHQIIAACRK
ncbi:type 1 glutamine amidotransferase [bacterium]|nr:type 1 glutamine amidotransferase [bacterium]